MIYQKNIIVAIVALLLLLGVWMFSAPKSQPASPLEPVISAPKGSVATSTQALPPASSPQSSLVSPAPPSQTAPAPRIELSGQADFHYDIIAGTTPCGDKIGTVHVVSSDPSKELYWGFTGSKPIWLSFSQVEGKTPTGIEMSYNCILSGAEEDIDWKFTLVEKTKEGKWVDGYVRYITLKGDIKNE